VAYSIIGDGRLSTRRSDGPEVRIRGRGDTPLEVELLYEVLVEEPSGFAPARLLFESVLEYRWVQTDVTYFLGNDRDFRFDLIEIEGSEHVERMASSGMNRRQPVGQRLGGVIDERSVRHFRIGFDDYGTFEVLCLDLEVTVGPELVVSRRQATQNTQ
jgi:hypothetical protein